MKDIKMPDDVMRDYEQQLQQGYLAGNTSNLNLLQEQMNNSPQQTNYIKEQLSLGEELERIDYLLKGYTLGYDSDGVQKWLPPIDEDMEILSEYGVNHIRQIISWYLNKNTLLSHYDDEMILKKMKNFVHALNTSIYLKYQKVFKYPSFNRCKKELTEEVERKAKTKHLAYELLGKKIDLSTIRKEVVVEMEERIEYEFEKIRKRLMKIKYTQFEILIRQITDAVHSAYRRAYFGMERTSLRKNVYVTETNGMLPQINNKDRGSMINPINWFK